MSEVKTSKFISKESIVGRLSPHDSSVEGLLAKLGVAWVGFFGGITLSDIFTFASIIYVILNIYVLVRDKIVRREKSKDDRDISSGE